MLEPQDRPLDILSSSISHSVNRSVNNSVSNSVSHSVTLSDNNSQIFSASTSDTHFKSNSGKSDTHSAGRRVQFTVIPQHESTVRKLSSFSAIDLPALSQVVRSISFDSVDFGDSLDDFREVLTRKQWRAFVRTMYKRKGKKILPKNVPLPSGETPGGGINSGEFGWKIGDRIVGEGTGKVVQRGSRLMEERLKKMKIGDGFLTEKEKHCLWTFCMSMKGQWLLRTQKWDY